MHQQTVLHQSFPEVMYEITTYIQLGCMMMSDTVTQSKGGSLLY